MSRLGRQVVVVAQGKVGERALASLTAIPGSRKGVGLMRTGLAGASASMVDARRSLAVTTDSRPVAEFSQDWVTATVLADAERLEPLVSPHVDVVAANPHLVEALECYAEVRGSVTGAARLLHLHPNAVAYRLERWAELTGWDPRTHRGLSDSLLAVALARIPPASTGSD